MATRTEDHAKASATLERKPAEGAPQGNGANKSSLPPKNAPARTPVRKTYFVVLALDEKLKRLTRFSDDEIPPPQDPCDDRARHIAMHLNRRSEESPPQEELVFAAAVDKVAHVLNELCFEQRRMSDARFRHYYVELFSLANLVLQEGRLTLDAGKTLLAGIEEEVIQLEGVSVKNARIRELARAAGGLSIPFLIAYVALSLLAPKPHPTLQMLHIDPATLASFMVLWVGCFLGVCLSYGLRKPKLTVDDLVATTEPDFFRPVVRLAFAGTLTMILVMFAMLNFVDFSVAEFKLSKAVQPGYELLAFVLGVICGISELFLPTRILGQTSKLLPGTQPSR